MQKIETLNSSYHYEKALSSLSELSKKNEKMINEFIDANALGKTALKKAPNKTANVRARTKNIYLLKISAKFFNKDLDKLTGNDIEKLVRALNDNKLKKSNGQPYSEQTKASIKKVLIMFLRFHIKDKENFEKLTDWIETRYKKKEIPALSEDEIKQLLNSCTTIKQSVLIALLFDSGARIEELLNVRLSDLTKVEDSNMDYYRITIKTEFSKTKGRTFSLLWSPTTQILREWLAEHPEKNNLDSPLYPTTYDGVRMLLSKIGKRALNRKVNAHLFRHSSATYYAGQGMDYFQLCKRYGWAVGSQVPQMYIDRSGIKEKEIITKTENKRVDDLQKEIELMKKRERIKNEQFEQMKKMLNSVIGDGTSTIKLMEKRISKR